MICVRNHIQGGKAKLIPYTGKVSNNVKIHVKMLALCEKIKTLYKIT